MTTEELTGVVNTYLPKAGAQNVKTVQADRGEVLSVTYNAQSPIPINFPTSGWTYSGTHTDPAGERRWKVDFAKIKIYGEN